MQTAMKPHSIKSLVVRTDFLLPRPHTQENLLPTGMSPMSSSKPDRRRKTWHVPVKQKTMLPERFALYESWQSDLPKFFYHFQTLQSVTA